MKIICIFFILINYINAMNCSNYSAFQQYNGHYYSVSIDKLTFEDAKQIAINNGGTLAIPNSQAENDFIRNLIGGGSVGWIGIHDPNKLQNFCYGTNCVYDSSRFKDVKGNSLIYKNFAPYQPDNLVKEYDVVDGKQMVSPLGEHWVGMNGNNGKWYDFGNHADTYNNPVKYKAVFEFENLNECKPLTDDGVQELTGKFCNTKIWDSTIDTLTMGQTLDCQLDSYGNEYCPSALAQCAEQWDYDSGFSTAGVGSVTDYTSKNENTTTVTTSQIISSVTGGGNTPNGCNKVWVSTNGSDTMTFYNGCGDGSFNVRVAGASITGGGSAYTYTNRVWVSTNGSNIMDFIDFSVKITKKTCPSGYVLNGTNCKKTITTLTCPSGYIETTGAETSKGECKKTKEYTYYNYLCNNETNTQGYNYVPINSGGDTGKTDPDNTVQNDLTNPLNDSTPPLNNCKRQKFTCLANAERPCSYVDNSWQCSPFPCMGQSNLENLDTQVGSSDKDNNGWSEDGACTGTIYIFNGKSNKCRNWDMFFGLVGGGCCDKEKVFAGLVACKENEKLLAKQREQKQAHYIGNFCSKQLKLGFVKICVQKSDSYCTFNSSLAKIIQEQGREQLGISWGSPDNPQCRGFTPEEFQKIDFSKIDLTEFVKDIQSSIQTSVIQNLGTYVKDKVGDFYGN